MQIEKGIDKIVMTIRMMILDQPGSFGRVAAAIGNARGNIGDIRLVGYGLEYNTRDLTVFVDDEAHLQEVLEELGKVDGVIISDIIDPVLELHKGGKISVKARMAVDNISTMRKIYTPGVAKVCKLIQRKPDLAYDYTAIGNTVAIVTNGTAILAWGHRAVPGMPVMEGRRSCSTLVGINGADLLQTKDTGRSSGRWLHRLTFGATAEDIKAPSAEIEERLTRCSTSRSCTTTGTDRRVVLAALERQPVRRHAG
jgi:malate dehydrogenase (oxaloacetate-decarboxylating)